jgi:FtsZ-binding cell division protein ZapB
MRRLLLIFSLLMAAFLAVPALAENVTEVNNASINVTATENLNESMANTTILVNETGNLTAFNSTMELNQQNQTLNQSINTPVNRTKTNETAEISLEELVKILQSQLEELKKQNEILREENRKLRQEIANLTKRLEELKKKPITWDDIAEKVDEYYVQFVYWTGWLWPMLTFYLIYRYRRPAVEAEEERIQEAVEKLAKEKQREWYSFQIRRRGIEAFAEDETELAIFRALGIHTVADILDRSEQEIVEAFKAKYQPTADIEEHFKNRLKEIKEKLKGADSNA